MKSGVFRWNQLFTQAPKTSLISPSYNFECQCGKQPKYLHYNLAGATPLLRYSLHTTKIRPVSGGFTYSLRLAPAASWPSYNCCLGKLAFDSTTNQGKSWRIFLCLSHKFVRTQSNFSIFCHADRPARFPLT